MIPRKHQDSRVPPHDEESQEFRRTKTGPSSQSNEDEVTCLKCNVHRQPHVVFRKAGQSSRGAGDVIQVSELTLIVKRILIRKAV